MSEHEELAQWLESEADDYDDFYPPKSSLKLYRAAALLREASPQPPQANTTHPTPTEPPTDD